MGLNSLNIKGGGYLLSRADLPGVVNDTQEYTVQLSFYQWQGHRHTSWKHGSGSQTVGS